MAADGLLVAVWGVITLTLMRSSIVQLAFWNFKLAGPQGGQLAYFLHKNGTLSRSPLLKIVVIIVDCRRQASCLSLTPTPPPASSTAHMVFSFPVLLVALLQKNYDAVIWRPCLATDKGNER